MIKRMIMLCAATLVLAPFTTAPAHAQGRDPVISEVYVHLGDPADLNNPSTLTIRGQNLMGRPSRDETVVMLGEQGPLELVGDPTDTEIKVQCFADHSLSNQDNFTCNPGDYKLTVAVVRTDRRWRWHRRDIRRVATYDLTIAAAGGGAQPPNSPNVDLLKRKLDDTTRALCNLTEQVKIVLGENSLSQVDLIEMNMGLCGG